MPLSAEWRWSYESLVRLLTGPPMSIFAGAGLGLLALMFLPVLIALLRRRLLVAFVAFIMVLVSIPALVHPLAGIAIWLAALCVGAFAGPRKVIVVQRTP